MKILVLGCKGQLGRCLNDQLVNTDHEVIYTSREQIDIADFEVTKSKILEFSPDIIINATAYTAVDKAEEDQETADLINHLAVKNIANIYTINKENLTKDKPIQVSSSKKDINWLPSGNETKFHITLRVYNPDESVYKNLESLELPIIKKIEK